ncbi:hypothetical protein L2E82_04245 [Cichorium intybus]|uniref:Uncharacterized protein n=1 Tax=Cichorium intybus TaxID=13427 RepID=A0ACB9H535_CICIN|nr:hypothetical protein L2E82_04245 [Cichorium intybus]
MATLAQEDGGDDVMVVLTCVDHEQDDNNHYQDEDEVTISTMDVYNWNFPSILQHRIIKAKVQRNRLIQHSSYFRGLLGGNFGISDPDLEILLQWNQPTFLSLLASLFGAEVDISSENFLSLFEGALYFGMETILSKCKAWLTKSISVNGVTMLQLNDLVSIWEFGFELELVNNYLPELCTTYLAKNFIWAMSCTSFCDVPYELLLSSTKHPYLTIDSEKQLCDAILIWISTNKERYNEDACVDLLKQIRISLLPLWFAIGKNTHQSLSICYNKSSYETMIGKRDIDLLNLRIRLTQFTQLVDLSSCPHINPKILLLSILPISQNLEPKLIKKAENIIMNHKHIIENDFPWEMWSNLTFEAVNEIDISNCPMLNLEVAIEIFNKSFPSLKKLKATNHLSFKTIKLLQMLKKCPFLTDIDLTVDINPVIPTRVSILSSFSVSTPRSSSISCYHMSTSLPSNITKLTLDGRIDINDIDLRDISNICVSLTYISLKGCSSLSDVGISTLISKCLKLNSIVACDTSFGQQSILTLFPLNTYYDDHIPSKHSGKNSPHGCNLQMLHIGGCKGIDLTCFSKFMSHANMLKSLCLRDTEVVDDVLFNFFGTSLEMLDISNTKVSSAGVAHVIYKNPGLKCLKTRGCDKLLHHETKNIFFEIGRSCKLDEISVGWGFTYLPLDPLKAALSSLKTIEVGLGGSLGQNGLNWLPSICPLLESVILYFQVISDDVIVNMLESLKHLKSFELCYCLGDTSSLSLKVCIPNLKNLRLERVTPWMTNVDLVNLTHNCPNLIHLSLLGCPLLNSESQTLISSGWPGLISIHLEECGEVTSNGVVSFFKCHALEDILLRHNGSGIQKSFIGEAVTKLSMLRKISLDICDAKDGDFDVPDVENRHFLSHVKIARCKSQRCSFNPQHVRASMVPPHQETLVFVWDSKQFTRTLVGERV